MLITSSPACGRTSLRLQLSGELIFAASLFVLGEKFLHKIRAVFVRTAEVVDRAADGKAAA
jgi:hypothetical protein